MNEPPKEITTYLLTDFDHLERVESSGSGPLEEDHYDLNGLRESKVDESGNSSLEFGVGITTGHSKAAASGSWSPTSSYIRGHQFLGYEGNGFYRPRYNVHEWDRTAEGLLATPMAMWLLH